MLVRQDAASPDGRLGGRPVVVAVEVDRALVTVSEAAALTLPVGAATLSAGSRPAENRRDARRTARVVHPAADRVRKQCVRVRRWCWAVCL